MISETTPRSPAYRAYAVLKRIGSDKSNWTEIGAAWPHKDGKGLSLKLDLLPASPEAEIVLREPKTEGSAK